MREDRLRAKSARRRTKSTTNAAHAYPIALHLLQRQFAPQQNEELDRVWVADITYIPTRQGWVYRAVVLDLASRRVVGWAMKNTLHSSLACDA